jgi:diguanylate cyclase (GGDEF)-like protein
MNKWLPILLPAVLFVVLVAVLILFDGANAWVNYPSFRVLPYLLMTLSFFLGVFFLQSRVSFFSLFLAVVTYYLDSTCATEGLSGKCDTIIFLSSIYIPVFGVLFYHLGERGFLTMDGYVRLVIILSGVIVILLVPNIADMSRAISTTSIRLFSPPTDLLRIPLAGLLVLIVCLPFFFFRSGFESPLLGYFFGLAVLFVFAGLSMSSSVWPEESRRVVLLSFMSGASVTLTWAVMESSWRNANIDELTELPGRRSLKNHLARLGSSYAIAMVDIDHFKKVNDRFGHDTGDQVLRFIASFLRYNSAGKAYRYGGEEFAIVCDGGKFKEVLAQLDELRESISNREFIVRSRLRPKQTSGKGGRPAGRDEVSKTITITVSIGVAQPGKKYFSAQEVIEAADKALYRAKKAGRNQVKSTR